MKLLNNFIVPDKTAVIDTLSIKLRKHISLKNIKKLIVEKVTFLYKKNAMDVPMIDDFSTGIWFVSDYIYERQLAGAFNNFKKNGFLYFNPAKFASSILNSFTSILAESLKIRGFSNSCIIADINNMLMEFAASNMLTGVMLNIYRQNKSVFLEIILLKRSG